MGTKVTIEEHKGWLRLRWSWQGKRPTLAIGLRDSPVARTAALRKAVQIEGDIATENYDPTLRKYRGQGKVKAESLPVVKLFEKFTAYRVRRHRGKTTAKKYQALALYIGRHFAGVEVAAVDDDVADRFRLLLGEHLADRTTQEYLRLISGCWEHGIKLDLVKSNPWPDVIERVHVRPKQPPRPFTRSEVTLILECFRNHRDYAHYYDYVAFLLGVGCRPGEAIGLQWKHLTEDCSKVWIGETLTRGVRDATKTNKARRFNLPPHLATMLLSRRPSGWKSDDLVFPAPGGGAIDDHNFRNRAWDKVLKASHIEYRKPSNTRHTFVSHSLAAGVDPYALCQITGHDLQVMLSSYAADISGGLQCPDLFSL